MKFSFFHPLRFRVDNARVFQRISMNLSMTVGQAACPVDILNARLTVSCIAESYRLLRVNQAKELATARV